jgi:YD repeat-containing protein
LYQVLQPGNATTTYTYDTHGNLATVTDAEGHVTIYTYDDLDRLVSTDSPDTGITHYSYDESGNLRFKVQNNNTIEYQYDQLSRLTHILYSDATQNVTMTYDTGLGAVGRPATVTAPSRSVEEKKWESGVKP